VYKASPDDFVVLAAVVTCNADVPCSPTSPLPPVCFSPLKEILKRHCFLKSSL
ncbi:mCG144632, partial [Mus musculus]